MNNTNLDKDNFVRAIAEKTGYSIGDSRNFLDNMIEVFAECIVNEIPIDVRGFGHLYFQTLPERDGAKPTKGIKGKSEKMRYPQTTRVVFKLASNLRNLAKMEFVDDENENEEV